MADHKHASGAPLWGVAAEFDTADALIAAIEAVGPFGRVDAFSPVPLQDAAEALRVQTRPIYPFAIAGAVLGAAAMFGMIVYATLVSYRFNIGGRPMFSWPSYVVPSVSFGALTAALAVVGAFFVLSRLPRLNHPSFNIHNFTRVTEDRFFVAVEARDAHFEAERVVDVLNALSMQPRRISLVPR